MGTPILETDAGKIYNKMPFFFSQKKKNFTEYKAQHQVLQALNISQEGPIYKTVDAADTSRQCSSTIEDVEVKIR